MMHTPSQWLRRSRTDTIIAGVASGIGHYLAVDPVIVRLAFVALALTGVGALLYPLLWIIMPLEGSAQPGPQQARSDLRQRAQNLGVEMRSVFVAGGPARARRYDAMTGAPAGDETEIPIDNLNPSGEPGATAQRSGRLLGIALLGIGAFVLLSMVFGPAFGRLLLPLLMVAAGVFILRRGM